MAVGKDALPSGSLAGGNLRVEVVAGCLYAPSCREGGCSRKFLVWLVATPCIGPAASGIHRDAGSAHDRQPAPHPRMRLTLQVYGRTILWACPRGYVHQLETGVPLWVFQHHVT